MISRQSTAVGRWFLEIKKKYTQTIQTWAVLVNISHLMAVGTEVYKEQVQQRERGKKP